MIDIIVILILLAIVGKIIYYLIKAKKQGQSCIGCPYGKQCGGHCSSKSKNENMFD